LEWFLTDDTRAQLSDVYVNLSFTHKTKREANKYCPLFDNGTFNPFVVY